ncbi:hypothetical protein RAB56_00248 [Escherichia phage iGC_PHA_EC001]|uniref:Uncharacterized protein n=1 Tax=Dompiswa phage TSP7_1 TaxID=2793345 RepID=A0A7T3N5Q0_9CAUD|nr:MAG: hypothetical protein M1M20_gp166 [Dompiswa phage TSP7_1]QPX71995.1 MAG: hypothetical protein [Dompiswa phage TSP7_1]WMI32814.1 hypothetical protein RAB56_00248 [Escherichia phage iGC_PHA_EC001]
MEEKLERIIELAMSIGYDDCFLQTIGETQNDYDSWVKELEELKTSLIADFAEAEDKADRYNHLCR